MGDQDTRRLLLQKPPILINRLKAAEGNAIRLIFSQFIQSQMMQRKVSV
jgi:hypothetical protein